MCVRRRLYELRRPPRLVIGDLGGEGPILRGEGACKHLTCAAIRAQDHYAITKHLSLTKSRQGVRPAMDMPFVEPVFWAAIRA